MGTCVPSTSASVDRARVSAKSRGAARKINISRQYRTKVTFQSSIVPLFRVKNREILVARHRYRVVYYPKTTRFLGTPRFISCRRQASFCRSGRRLFRICTHSRDSRNNGPSKYLFFGPDLQGDRLISLKATMNRTERRVLTSELRVSDVLGP